jgi:hypothetical protein
MTPNARLHLAHALRMHLRWRRANGYRFPPELLAIANGGHLPPQREEHRRPRHHRRVLVTYDDAAYMLATSRRSVARLVAAGELQVVGKGSGRRIVVKSLEDYGRPD